MMDELPYQLFKKYSVNLKNKFFSCIHNDRFGMKNKRSIGTFRLVISDLQLSVMRFHDQLSQMQTETEICIVSLIC